MQHKIFNSKRYCIGKFCYFKIKVTVFKIKYYLLGIHFFSRPNPWYLNILRSHNESQEKHILCVDSLTDPYAEAIDSYTFFVFLQKKNIKSKYVLLKNNKLYEKLKSQNALHDIIGVDSLNDFVFNHIDLIGRTKKIISSFGLLEYNLWFKGLPFLDFILLHHGVILLKKWCIYSYNSKLYDKIIVPTKPTRRLYLDEKQADEKSMICCGLPRWDLLKRTKESPRRIFVFFTHRSTFLEAPELAADYFKSILDFFNDSRLVSAIERKDVIIEWTIHHALLNINIPIPPIPDYIHLVDSSDISKHISKTDLLITDYSSICFDVMYLNIPTVFYRFDTGRLSQFNQADVSMINEALLEDPVLYNCCYDKEMALSKVIHYIDTDFVLEPENLEKNRKIFWTEDNICETLYKKLDI